MFVGHGLLAFAIAAWAATRYRRSPALAVGSGATSDGYDDSVSAALAVGAVAAAFATLPDVDILYALVGLLSAEGGALAFTESFWAASTVVHRTITHSLVIGTAAAGAFALWRREALPERIAAVAALLGLVAVAVAESGPLGGVVTAAFALGGLAITVAAGRYGLGPRAVLTAALIGLLTHPFGDLFTGTPPALLYPLEVTVFAERVAISTDPTLHLLGAMGLELATIWLATAVYLWLTGRAVRAHVTRSSALGVGYAGAVLAVPAPTLTLSYPFVFTILGVGIGCGIIGAGVGRVRGRARAALALSAAVTALTAVTVAVGAYAGIYLLVR